MYETKGFLPYIGWLVAFHWVRDRIKDRVRFRVYII